jgi:hypothetical protein
LLIGHSLLMLLLLIGLIRLVSLLFSCDYLLKFIFKGFGL